MKRILLSTFLFSNLFQGCDAQGKAFKVGDAIPDFSLLDQNNCLFKSAEYVGKKILVIYFYPKDDTPGCTIQAKSFTATKADFDAAGIDVIGVSADDVASHKNFCNKFAFTIDLLSDTDASLMKSLGIGQAEWKGMKFWERSSFVVDPNGVIRKVYEKVNPEGHERVLLDDIEGMKAKAA